MQAVIGACLHCCPAALEYQAFKCTSADYLEPPICGGSANADVGGSIGSGQSAAIGALYGQDGYSLSYVLRQMCNMMTWLWAAACHST